ncbi:thioredoxin-like protein [Trametes meyenii]|nr:thioredoxin-like protein [Trametes meyenii]
MSDTERITLYAASDSPFPHRVRLALEEAKATYDIIWIDLMNKEEWYEKKVNPAGGKVPFLVYGGPKLQPDEAPTPESFKFAESVVILEFLADIFPDAHLLPADPTLRARARFFYHEVDNKLLKAFLGWVFMSVPTEALLSTLEYFQSLLPPTGYVAGEWSIADASITPVLARFMYSATTGRGAFKPEVAKEALEAFESSRFTRLRKYYEDNMARPSMAKTWDQAELQPRFEQRLDRFFKTGIINSEVRVPLPPAQ